MISRYERLRQDQLAILVPELLLAGQLIDRSAMAWCIAAFGREQMTRVAIEEWMAASPIYTRRMQGALGYEGDDVVTIFKGLQLDIGAPPQFMDFRYTVHDRWHGEFHLDPSKEQELVAHLKTAELYTSASPKDRVFSPPIDYPPHERAVEIEIDLGAGPAQCAVLGADLTHEYVSENADYRS